MIPNQIGRYEDLTLIGQGAMGQVYRARDPELDREVALKLVTPPDPIRSNEWERRFRREVRAAGQLNHPHIVTIHHADLKHEPPYVVMEFLAGGTLKERLAQTPVFWQEALALLRPLCQALAYAHRAGVTHRDVKPANIMFAGDRADTLKLVDFGLARWEGAEQVTQTGEVVGTPAYMSPEQARGEPVDARTDIYSLGLVLFEAIAGYNPHDKGSTGQTWAAIISEEPIDLAPLEAKAPPEVIELIGRAVARDRSRRYPNIEALCQALAACLEQPANDWEATSPPPSDQGPEIENPQGISLPTCAEDILRIMFAGHRRLVIDKELGGGFSGGRVFLVLPIRSDGVSELPAVVKMAPGWLIQQEWLAYQECIHHQWPGVAEIQGEPVLPPGCDWGGLRYPLAGHSRAFRIESLYQYCRQASTEDVRYVLEEQLFQIARRPWQFGQPHPAFPMGASYDPWLPVNLIVKPAEPPDGAQVHDIGPNLPAGPPPAADDYVRLKGFVISEVDPVDKAVTLNLSPRADGQPNSYRLRLQPVVNVDRYQVNNIVNVIEGKVTQTRHDLLQAEVERVLGQHVQLSAQNVTLPDGTSLPNPLDKLSATLAQRPNVRVACLHGDLNLENVLVEPASREPRLIDFAAARRDHVLHDLLHLEAEVVTKLLPEALAEARLPVDAIYPFYEQLHCTVLHPDQFGPPKLSLVAWKRPLATLRALRKLAALEKYFRMLVTIRKMARNYLFDRHDWAEYYQGLTLYLLGALKFSNLNQVSGAKQVAFLGAAATQQLMAHPPGCDTTWVLDWKMAAKEVPAFEPGMTDGLTLSLKQVPWRNFPMRPAWAFSIVSLLLSLMLVIAALFLFRPTDKALGQPLATIISAIPEVDVRRAGADRLIPATFGTLLYQNDVVNTYVAAAATVACENGNLYNLPEQSNMTVDCEDTTDVRFGGQLNQTISRQLMSASDPVTTTRASETRSRGEERKTPFLISPRNTVITDTKPALHWQAVPDASGYRLTLNLLSGETWSRETTETSLLYPDEVFPLTPGSAVIVSLTMLDDDSAADKSILRVMDEANQADLAQAEAEIQALDLDETAQAYLLAQLYRGREMWTAAIGQLEWLTDGVGVDSANLWQQLGDLYFEVGLYAQAEENYTQALTAAEASADKSAQVAAHIGLARAAHAFEETEEALAHLTIAEELYREAGEIERAEMLAAERAKLEK